MSKRSDQGRFSEVGVDFSDAGERMEAIAIHGARAADSFSARSPEGEGGI